MRYKFLAMPGYAIQFLRSKRLQKFIWVAVGAIATLMVVTNFNVSKATAQIPFLPILQSPQLGIHDSATPATKPITVQLNREQNRHIQEAKRRLFQLAQAMIWGGGSFFILGLFPYTRSLQIAILST
jgi:hypothetical protein